MTVYPLRSRALSQARSALFPNPSSFSCTRGLPYISARLTINSLPPCRFLWPDTGVSFASSSLSLSPTSDPRDLSFQESKNIATSRRPRWSEQPISQLEDGWGSLPLPWSAWCPVNCFPNIALHWRPSQSGTVPMSPHPPWPALPCTVLSSLRAHLQVLPAHAALLCLKLSKHTAAPGFVLLVPSAWNVLPPASTWLAPFPSSRFCSNVTLFKMEMNSLAHSVLSPALFFSITLITIWYIAGINVLIGLLSVFRDWIFTCFVHGSILEAENNT